MGSSTRQGYSAANSRVNVDIVEELPADNRHGYFTSEDPERGSDKGQIDKSRFFTEKGNGARFCFSCLLVLESSCNFNSKIKFNTVMD